LTLEPHAVCEGKKVQGSSRVMPDRGPRPSTDRPGPASSSTSSAVLASRSCRSTASNRTWSCTSAPSSRSQW